MPIPPEEDPSRPHPSTTQRPQEPAQTYISERERLPALEIARRSTPDPFDHRKVGWIGAHSLLVLYFREKELPLCPVFIRVRFGPTAENPVQGAIDLREEFEKTHAIERGFRLGHVYTVSVTCQEVVVRDEPDLSRRPRVLYIGGHACKAMVPLLKALEDAFRRSEPVPSTFHLTTASLGSEEPPRIERGRY